MPASLVDGVKKTALSSMTPAIDSMRKSGVSESVIMKIAEHSTREMFLRYDTVDDADTRKAFEQLEGFLKSNDQSNDQAPQKATRS